MFHRRQSFFSLKFLSNFDNFNIFFFNFHFFFEIIEFMFHLNCIKKFCDKNNNNRNYDRNHCKFNVEICLYIVFLLSF